MRILTILILLVALASAPSLACEGQDGDTGSASGSGSAASAGSSGGNNGNGQGSGSSGNSSASVDSGDSEGGDKPYSIRGSYDTQSLNVPDSLCDHEPTWFIWKIFSCKPNKNWVLYKKKDQPITLTVEDN
jgi:hypothetical protein